MYMCASSMIKYQIVILGKATVTEEMATVTFIDLQCGVTYNITAEGTFLNETLLGSRSSHASVIPGQCPMTSSEYINYSVCVYIDF